MSSSRPLILALTTCLALAACSGAPSESDVRHAVQRQMEDQQKAQTAALGSSDFLNEQFAQQRKMVESIKLVGCKSDGEKAYNCDLEIGGKALSGRFVKGSNGWIAASN